MASINPVYARIVARRLIDAGVDETALFRGTTLNSQVLWQQKEMELKPFTRLLLNAGDLYDQEPIGFLIGAHHSATALGETGMAMGVAPDLRRGFQALSSFAALHTDYIRAHLDSTVAGLAVRLSFEGEAAAVLGSHVEASMMLFRRYVETHTTRRLRDARFEFPYPAPEHVATYFHRLGQNVLFDRPAAAMFLPSHWLDVPSPFYNPEIWMRSLQQLSERVKQIGSTDKSAYLRQVLALLRSEVPPLPGLADIASRLHLSQRTLNRRLAEEGTSFRELRSQLLDEWARNYLTDTGASIEAIAATLGYSDTANFRRAFRERHAMTPSDYRAQQRRELASVAPVRPEP